MNYELRACLLLVSKSTVEQCIGIVLVCFSTNLTVEHLHFSLATLHLCHLLRRHSSPP